MKIINKRIFCALTLISSTFLPYLTINAKATANIPRAKTWTEDSGNISDGERGFMFEDNRGNLWSVGYGTPLQKYDYGASRWETSEAIRGNLKDGTGGFMFQDRRGNLWSAGFSSPLQKYDYGASRWETSDAIKGNLSDGEGGFMFEDSRGYLWSAGYDTPLQKYDYGASRWETSDAIKGNIDDGEGEGEGGFIFEDSKDNLWSARVGTPLQKYDYSTSGWEKGPAIQGNLGNGDDGFMFQDRRGNLWSAGNATPLQRYDYGTNRWETSPEITGNLKDGLGGFMFQDRRGNLWSAGNATPLQRYDYGTNRWETSNDIAGNLSNGEGGFMFQDRRGNLWSAGIDTPLQKYDYGTRTWVSSGDIPGNLSDGFSGFMFEDSKGYLWSAGDDTPLQVMYSDKDVASVIALIQTNTGMTKSVTNAISPVDIDTLFDANALSSLGTGGTFPGDLRTTTLTYSHGGISIDGDLTVTVTITKGETIAIAIFRVKVSGIDAADKLAINEVKNAILAISSVSKDATTDIPLKSNAAFNVAAFKALGGTDEAFPTNIRGTTLTYSHGGITSDGNLEVTVTIAKGRATDVASFTVAVSGIVLAKVKKEANKFKNFNSADSLNSAAAILPLNVENVKTQFEAISGYKVPNLTGGYSISKIIVKTILDANTKKVVYTVTISDTSSNTATKDIVVTFAVTQNKGLSGGVIAGITITFILGVGIVGFLIYYYFKKIKKTKIKH